MGIRRWDQMAERAMKRCRLHGCQALTRDQSGYCDQHRQGFRKEKGDLKTGDPFYSSWRWRRLRSWFLRQHPVCQRCESSVASVVHHREPVKEGGNHYLIDNLEALCQACHNAEHHSARACRGGSESLGMPPSSTDGLILRTASEKNKF